MVLQLQPSIKTRQGIKLEYLELLRKLVSYRTINDPARGIRPTRDCPEFLQTQLASHNFKAEIIEQKNFFSVLGTHGEGRPVTLLLAHFDVVPIGPGWKTNPFELTIQQNSGYGRGTADDKGNVTALLLVAKEISKLAHSGTIAIAMTGDEEIGGANGAMAVRKRLEKQNLFPDYLVTADGVGMRIVTRRRNTCGITISVPKHPQRIQGTTKQQKFTTEYFRRESRHSAYFFPGVDRHAFLAASSFLLQHPSLQVGKVSGSFVKSNVVPDWIELQTIDSTSPKKETKCDMNLTRLLKVLLPISRINFPTHHSDYGITISPNLFHDIPHSWEIYCDGRVMTTDRKALEAALNAVLDEKLVGIKYKATVQMGKAFMNTPKDAQLVQQAQKVAKRLGINPQPIELGGASDTRHFSDRPIEAMDFGPIGYAVHGSNEHVILDSIPQTAIYYTHLIKALHKNT